MPDNPAATISANERKRVNRNKFLAKKILEIIATPGRWLDDAMFGKKPDKAGSFLGGMGEK